MKFIIRNQAQIANSYIRYVQWKIRKLNNKFGQLIYAEVYVQQTGSTPNTYQANLKLGVPGPDIIVSAKSKDLNELWCKVLKKTERQLRKIAERKSRHATKIEIA